MLGGHNRLASLPRFRYCRDSMHRVLRRLFRAWLVALAVFAAIPGSAEALEQLVELVGHGHPAHSVPGEADRFCIEHEDVAPCSGPTCGCHASPIVVAAMQAEFGWRDGWLLWSESFPPLTLHEALDRREWNEARGMSRATSPPVLPPSRTA